MIQYINRKSSFPSMMKLKLCVYYDTVASDCDVMFMYRAENGPCGYVVIPVESGKTKLIWIINSNLKVSCLTSYGCVSE